MSFLEAIILGIIQGLSEFLPVSSSGHLELVKAIFGNDTLPKESMFTTVILHGATALSTIVVFRKEIKEILFGLFQFKWNRQTIFSIKIILSMIPAAIVGLTFNDQIEQLFSKNILLVALMLVVTAFLLIFADKAKNTKKEVSYLNAFWVGVAQAIAIIPGISRSGATISTSVLLGIDRTKATRFSFLMVVPLILGKMAQDLISLETIPSKDFLMPNVVGFIAAFFTGLLACTWMIKLVQKSKLIYFSFYCFLVAIVAIVFISL